RKGVSKLRACGPAVETSRGTWTGARAGASSKRSVARSITRSITTPHLAFGCPPMAEFVHLHVHSEFSLLDGAIRCRSLAGEAQKLGMRGVALTDHANMFGAIHHYKGCKAAGITPIIGCEVNVARVSEKGSRPSDDPPLDHLVLIAENATGYKNLLRIVSRGHL